LDFRSDNMRLQSLVYVCVWKPVRLDGAAWSSLVFCRVSVRFCEAIDYAGQKHTTADVSMRMRLVAGLYHRGQWRTMGGALSARRPVRITNLLSLPVIHSKHSMINLCEFFRALLDNRYSCERRGECQKTCTGGFVLGCAIISAVMIEPVRERDRPMPLGSVDFTEVSGRALLCRAQARYVGVTPGNLGGGSGVLLVQRSRPLCAVFMGGHRIIGPGGRFGASRSPRKRRNCTWSLSVAVRGCESPCRGSFSAVTLKRTATWCPDCTGFHSPLR